MLFSLVPLFPLGLDQATNWPPRERGPRQQARHCYGKLHAAFGIITGVATKSDECSDVSRITSQAQELTTRISHLYQTPPLFEPLRRAAESILGNEVGGRIGETKDALEKACGNAVDTVLKNTDLMRHVEELWGTLTQYGRDLNSPWSAGLAFLGASLGAIAGLPIAGVVTIGAGSVLAGPVLQAKLRSMLVAPTIPGEVIEAISEDSLTYDSMIRSNVLWALVLELQGNSEATIAATLQELLNEDLDSCVDSADKVTTLLNAVEGRFLAISPNA